MPAEIIHAIARPTEQRDHDITIDELDWLYQILGHKDTGHYW